MKRLFLLFVAAAFCTPASAQELTDRDHRVAQVLLNSTHLRELEAPDDRSVLGYKRACADDTGNTYCHEVRNLTDENGRKHAWSLRIQYAPGGWEESSSGPEPVAEDPDGTQYYVLPSRKAKDGTTRVAARLTMGELRMTLQDSRSGGLDQSSHLALMKQRWSFVLEQAVKMKLLLVDDQPRLVVALGETEWFGPSRELEDGAVVSVDDELTQRTVFPLTVWVDPPPVTEENTQYVINLDVDAEGMRETQITYADGKPVHYRSAVDTYQIVIDTEEEPFASLLVHFRPIQLTDDSPLGQKAVLSFTSDTVDGGTTITLHRTTWFPVLRRFELDQEFVMRNPEGAKSESTSPEVKSDPLLDQAWRFNSARYAAADIVGAWRKLAPVVAIRPGLDENSPGGRAANANQPVFEGTEPVVLGFKVDERYGSGYWDAQNVQGKEHTMSPWVEDVPQKVYVDLWLARDPEPPSTTYAEVLRGLEDEFEDLFGPEPEVEGEGEEAEEPTDTSPQLNQHERQVKLRQEVFVEEYLFQVVQISHESLAWNDETPADVRSETQRRLARGLRMPAGIEGWSNHFGTRSGSRDPISKYESTLPLGNLKNLDLDEGLRWIPRGEGLYELRLQLVLSSGDGNRREEIEAAIRVNVVGTEFKAKMVHRSGRRGG